MAATNGLLIAKFPDSCGTVEYDGEIDMGEVRSKHFQTQPDCTLAYTDRVLFWGGRAELGKVLDGDKIKATKKFKFDDLVAAVQDSGFVKSLLEETVAKAVLHGKPVSLRKGGKTWYAVVKHDEATHDIYTPLRAALGYQGSLVQVHGKVFGLTDVYWSEAVSIRIEERSGLLWLLLRPDVWISPLKERENATDFLRAKKLKRYNPKAFEVLSAWIRILLGDIGQGQSAVATAFPDADYPAPFEVSTRTAFSKRSAANG